MDFRAVAASPEQGARRSVYSDDRITITPEAYDAIKPGLPETDLAPSKGADRLIRLWLDRKFVDQLAQMRAKGESYSDVILRLAKA